jgi:hypothetical protein
MRPETLHLRVFLMGGNIVKFVMVHRTSLKATKHRYKLFKISLLHRLKPLEISGRTGRKKALIRMNGGDAFYAKGD